MKGQCIPDFYLIASLSKLWQVFKYDSTWEDAHSHSHDILFGIYIFLDSVGVIFYIKKEKEKKSISSQEASSRGRRLGR